jgi:hypothetical protein
MPAPRQQPTKKINTPIKSKIGALAADLGLNRHDTGAQGGGAPAVRSPVLQVRDALHTPRSHTVSYSMMSPPHRSR